MDGGSSGEGLGGGSKGELMRWWVGALSCMRGCEIWEGVGVSVVMKNMLFEILISGVHFIVTVRSVVDASRKKADYLS